MDDLDADPMLVARNLIGIGLAMGYPVDDLDDLYAETVRMKKVLEENL